MRYYVRPVAGEMIQGPYTLQEIRHLLESGTLRTTAQAVEASGQTLGQLQVSQEWQEVPALFGTLPEETPVAVARSVPGTVGARSELENRRRSVTGLFVAGVLLVWFARPIGELLVPKFPMGGLTAWDPDTARDLILGTRTVGVLVFSAGMGERVLLHLDAPGRGS